MELLKLILAFNPNVCHTDPSGKGFSLVPWVSIISPGQLILIYYLNLI